MRLTARDARRRLAAPAATLAVKWVIDYASSMGAVLAALIGLAVLAGLIYGVTGSTVARYAALFFVGLTALSVLGLMFLLPIS